LPPSILSDGETHNLVYLFYRFYLFDLLIDHLMPTFQLTIDAYVLILILGIAALVGFWGRSRQLAKKERRIHQLEQEMLDAHAEVLSFQREYHELESRVTGDTSPVISMKNNKNEEPPPHSTDRRTPVRKDRPTGTD